MLKKVKQKIKGNKKAKAATVEESAEMPATKAKATAPKKVVANATGKGWFEGDDPDGDTWFDRHVGFLNLLPAKARPAPDPDGNYCGGEWSYTITDGLTKARIEVLLRGGAFKIKTKADGSKPGDDIKQSFNMFKLGGPEQAWQHICELSGFVENVVTT